MVIRMFIPVFFPKQLQCDMLALHLFLKIREEMLECLETSVTISGIAALETVFKYGVIQSEKFVNTETVSVDLVHIIVYRLLVDADYLCGLTVGDSVLLQ